MSSPLCHEFGPSSPIRKRDSKEHKCSTEGYWESHGLKWVKVSSFRKKLTKTHLYIESEKGSGYIRGKSA